MIPLVVKMRHILRQRMAERGFPKEDEPRETLLLDGSHPPLCIGIEIRRPRRQWYALDPGCVDDLLKGGAVLPVPVMDQILPGRQATPRLHRHVAGHLHHPRCIGMRGDTRHMDLSTSKVDEKQP